MGKEKVVYFCHKGRVPSQLFGNFHSAGTYVDVITNIVNVQVTITVDVFELRCYRVANFTSSIEFEFERKPSRKIALNSNGEVNCRELARRPWDLHHHTFRLLCSKPAALIICGADHTKSEGTITRLPKWQSKWPHCINTGVNLVSPYKFLGQYSSLCISLP